MIYKNIFSSSNNILKKNFDDKNGKIGVNVDANFAIFVFNILNKKVFDEEK
jgi:hypothetical protein